MRAKKFDIIILGGGLSGCLSYLAILNQYPKLRVLLLEKSDHLCGNHTWCAHDSDIPIDIKNWFLSCVSKTWDRHLVRFPNYERKIESKYHAIRSEDLAKRTLSQKNGQISLQRNVTSTSYNIESGDWSIECDNSAAPETSIKEVYQSPAMLDCRGWKPLAESEKVGWQKFVGLDLELEEDHGLDFVTLMDAQVQQIDGYRFFYLLPWDQRRLLVEDTYYSNHPVLKEDRIEKEILLYCEKRGWKIKSRIRHEQGSLPLPMTNSLPTGKSSNGIGAGAGIFNPVTGYSLPQILWTLDQLLKLSTISQENLNRLFHCIESEHSSRQSYFVLLNQLMFLAAKNEERYKILQKFYTLPEPLIERFYAGQLTRLDQIRILTGKPPVPLSAAISVILNNFRK